VGPFSLANLKSSSKREEIDRGHIIAKTSDELFHELLNEYLKKIIVCG
jgi:hypothetical protein